MPALFTPLSKFPRLAALALLLAAPVAALAQTGGVGIGTLTPDASAALDIVSTSKGVLVPRVADATALATPATGLLVYQTGSPAGFYYNAGTAMAPNWQLLLTQASVVGDNLGNHTATQNLNLAGNALTGTGASIGTAVGLGVRADGGLNLGQNTAGNNIYLGYQSGRANTTGGYNQFSGYQSGRSNTTGVSNQFSGYQSGFTNTTGGYNQFSGLQSGYFNTTGSYNQFGGYLSGFANTTGSYNQFDGLQSGYNNTTGDYNQFSGLQSGYSNTTGSANMFSGYLSGYSNTTGTYNQFSGYQSGQANTTGNANTFSGLQSGYKNKTGNSNTFSGFQSGQTNLTGSNNTFSGYFSGANNYTGSSNTFSGNSSGLYNATGDNNTALGYGAGPTTSNLTNSTAIGYNAQVSQNNSLVLGNSGVNVGIGTTAPSQRLEVAGTVFSTSGGFKFPDGTTQTTASTGDNLGNHTATQNLNLVGNALVGTGASIGTAVGVGVRADGGLNLGQNTTGNNLYLGYQSGQANTTGSRNQFSGYNSGFANTTGSNNQFSGFQSGQANTTGSNNTALGYNSGPTTGNLTNAAAIGYTAQVSQSNSLVLGGTGANAVNVGIGTTAPDRPLTVQGSAASNELLSLRDNAGSTRWHFTLNSAAGPNAGLNLAESGVADARLFVRYGGNVGIGTASPSQALEVAGGSVKITTTGSGLIFPDGTTQTTASVGDNLGNHTATQNLNLAGNALTGTGASISGVGVGVRADGGLNLGQNTTGNNIYLGYQSGRANTTGGYNQFSGLQSGYFNTTGSYNQFSGFASGYNNTTGNNNQFSGYGSGYNNITGSNNTALGYQAGPTTSNLTNATAIGYNAQVSQSNSLVLGGTGANAVSVGIGTSAPAYTLDVVGTIRGSNVSPSDARFKEQVRPLTGALAAALALRPVRYRWNRLGVAHGGQASQPQLGLLAQEVEQVYPELVSTDQAGYKAVNYAQLTPVLLAALKEQQQQLETLKQQNAAARTELQTVKAQARADKTQATATLAAFEARLRRLEAGSAQAQR